MNASKVLIASAASLLAICVFAGCATTEDEGTGEASETYEVIAEEGTAFYRLGPQQPAGPDLQLEQGRRVTMLDRGFGFSKIELDNGWSGWVATDDVNPAPPEPEVVPLEENTAIVSRYRSEEAEDFEDFGDLSAPLPSGTSPLLEPAATDELQVPLELPEFRY